VTIDPALDSALAAPLLEPALENESAEQSGAGIAQATSLLAVGTIASRVLGFAQELLIAHYFGAGPLVDAFQIAITVPRDLYDLAISGHVNSALVPVLSEYAAKNKAELWRLVSALLSLTALLLSGLVLLLELFAGQIVTVYRGSPAPIEPLPLTQLVYHTPISAADIALTVSLLRVTSPALLFLGLFAIVSGMLYALKRFTLPAFAAALFNGAVVGSLVLLAPRIGIQGAAIGWVIGAAAQLILQFFALRDAHFRFDLGGALAHPGVRRIGLLYAPVLLSLVVDVLINRTFSYHLASQAGNGSIAYMNWATSLREFPMGLVGTAISIAVLPTLARQALSVTQQQAFKDTLGQGMRLVLMLIIPATVGMFVLAGPLVGLLFEHGAFTANDTTITAIALRLYLLGIPFAAIDLLLVFAFYARKDTLTPAIVGLISLAFYMLIALALRTGYSFYGLMIADSVKFLIHVTLCLLLLRQRLNGLGAQRLLLTLGKSVLATVLMALVVYASMRLISDLNNDDLRQRVPLVVRYALVIVPSALGGIVYLSLAYMLRMREFTWFIQAIRRRGTGR